MSITWIDIGTHVINMGTRSIDMGSPVIDMGTHVKFMGAHAFGGTWGGNLGAVRGLRALGRSPDPSQFIGTPKMTLCGVSETITVAPPRLLGKPRFRRLYANL